MALYHREILIAVSSQRDHCECVHLYYGLHALPVLWTTAIHRYFVRYIYAYVKAANVCCCFPSPFPQLSAAVMIQRTKILLTLPQQLPHQRQTKATRLVAVMRMMQIVSFRFHVAVRRAVYLNGSTMIRFYTLRLLTTAIAHAWTCTIPLNVIIFFSSLF